MSGCRISATSSARVVAEFLRHNFSPLNNFKRITLYIFSQLTINTNFVTEILNLAEENINFEFILIFYSQNLTIDFSRD